MGQFRAIKNHSEAAREALERPRSAKKSPRDRSWEPADGSRTVSETSGERPEGSRGALGTTPGAVRTRPWRRALSKCLPDRIFVVFVSSRERSDVLRVPRFTVFCCSWTKKATNGSEGRRSSKKQCFRPPKSTPGPPERFKIAPGRLGSSEKTRKLCEKFIRAGDEASRTANRAT